MNKKLLLLVSIVAVQGILSTINVEGQLYFKRSNARNPRPFNLLPNSEKVLSYLKKIFELFQLFDEILNDGYPDDHDKLADLNITDEERRDIQNNFTKFSQLLDNYKEEKNPQLTAYYLGMLPVEMKDTINKLVKIIQKNPKVIPYLAKRGTAYLASYAGYVKPKNGPWIKIKNTPIGKTFIKEAIQEDIMGESEEDTKEEEEDQKNQAMLNDLFGYNEKVDEYFGLLDYYK